MNNTSVTGKDPSFRSGRDDGLNFNLSPNLVEEDEHSSIEDIKELEAKLYSIIHYTDLTSCDTILPEDYDVQVGPDDEIIVSFKEDVLGNVPCGEGRALMDGEQSNKYIKSRIDSKGELHENQLCSDINDHDSDNGVTKVVSRAQIVGSGACNKSMTKSLTEENNNSNVTVVNNIKHMQEINTKVCIQGCGDNEMSEADVNDTTIITDKAYVGDNITRNRRTDNASADCNVGGDKIIKNCSNVVVIDLLDDTEEELEILQGEVIEIDDQKIKKNIPFNEINNDAKINDNDILLSFGCNDTTAGKKVENNKIKKKRKKKNWKTNFNSVKNTDESMVVTNIDSSQSPVRSYCSVKNGDSCGCNTSNTSHNKYGDCSEKTGLLDGCCNKNKPSRQNYTTESKRRKRWLAKLCPKKWLPSMVKFYSKTSRKKLNFDCLKLVKEMKERGSHWKHWKINQVDMFPQKSFTRIRCQRCRQPGHSWRLCTEPIKPIVCHMCGEIGHRVSRCPHKKCLTCGRSSSEFTQMCAKCTKEVWRGKVLCRVCNSRSHCTELCPDLWRGFHNTIDPKHITIPVTSEVPKENCSNCGRRGHLNKNCPAVQDMPYVMEDPYIYDYINVAAFCSTLFDNRVRRDGGVRDNSGGTPITLALRFKWGGVEQPVLLSNDCDRFLQELCDESQARLELYNDEVNNSGIILEVQGTTVQCRRVIDSVCLFLLQNTSKTTEGKTVSKTYYGGLGANITASSDPSSSLSRSILCKTLKCRKKEIISPFKKRRTL